jgi:uncharacterized damage-inducible protein DinB
MTAPAFVAAATGPNAEVIRQVIDLIAALDPVRYTRRIPTAFEASIGDHVRHIIEHYQSFLAGLGGSRVIDYEARPRNAMLEQEPTRACAALEEIACGLARIGQAAPLDELAYRAETWPEGQARTTLVRELEFLLSHTVHHCALVALMCRLQGHEPAPGFGIAPSTLRYQQTSLACAR